jgi:scyllo-inositol 2-dehydrogenase (NADP+)
MAEIGVGIAGYGMAATTFHIPLIAAEDRLHLRAIATSRPSIVLDEQPGVAAVSFDELIARDDIGLVVIAGRNADHFAQAKAALLADKHVIVEKPMTITSHEADELIAIGEERERMFTVFHNRRWDNGPLMLEALLRDGTLGALSACEFRFDRYVPEVRNRWREEAMPGSGMLYDLGSHLFFTARLLFGMPDTIVAEIDHQRPGSPVDDFFDVTLTYGSLRVRCRSSLLVPNNAVAIEAHGDRGSFVKYGFDPQEEMLKDGLVPHTQPWHSFESDNSYALTIAGEGTESRPLGAGTYEEFYTGVADAIIDEIPPPISAQYARDCIALIEQSFASANSGRRIEIKH